MGETRKAVTKRWERQQPVEFADQLLHKSDSVRQCARKTIQKWLQQEHSSGTAVLDEQKYGNLWQGLFFSLWMESKRSVQEELVGFIAGLSCSLPRSQHQLWLKVYWSTMQKGWDRLNLHHMSRFLLLLRKMLGEAFKRLRAGGWDLTDARNMCEVFTHDALSIGIDSVCCHSQRAIGASVVHYPNQALFLAFLRIFWSEFRPQLQNPGSLAYVACPPNCLMVLLEPFCALAKRCQNDTILHSVHRRILRAAPSGCRKSLAMYISDGLKGHPGEHVPADNRWLLQITASELLQASDDAFAESTSQTRLDGAVKEDAPQQLHISEDFTVDSIVMSYLCVSGGDANSAVLDVTTRKRAKKRRTCTRPGGDHAVVLDNEPQASASKVLPRISAVATGVKKKLRKTKRTADCLASSLHLAENVPSVLNSGLVNQQGAFSPQDLPKARIVKKKMRKKAIHALQAGDACQEQASKRRKGVSGRRISKL